MPLAAYCYLRAVGRGSYGEVTLVRHRRDGRQYVIKKLNLRNASSRERRAAEQEAQLLSRLKHPNIVTYKESWEGGDGLLYIVMGFCEGGDLYRKLKEQRGQLLPESQVVEWFVQIAMALQYLHEKHILHRDLKTQNVFLTRTNIIKVGDLGIARVLEGHCDMASTLIGTPYYMSPELFSNKPYNYKSDVWALGCCVYEMATLKHAFNAKDMNSLVYRIIEGKLPPMPKAYSAELAELIRTMLSKRPEERPSVRSVLRQPYIKRQISLFLEATKAKTCRNSVRDGDSKPTPASPVHSQKPGLHTEGLAPGQPPSSASGVGEDKCPSQENAVERAGPLKTPASLKGPARKGDLSSTAESLATISRVHIAIVPAQRWESAGSDSLVGGARPGRCGPSRELEGEDSIPGGKAGRLQDHPESSTEQENLAPSCSPDEATEAGGDVGKPLEPQPHESCVSSGRADVPTQGAENHPCAARGAVSGSGRTDVSASQDRPLSARERRRLKQSQEETGSSGPAVRSRSLCAVEPRRPQEEGQLLPGRQSSPDGGGSGVAAQERKLTRSVSEEELSSSASSTEKSDGEPKGGKGHTNEMHDLVQLMTQTLKLDPPESCEDLAVPNPPPAFRLHRKYRDTLVLHGKVAEEAEGFRFKELPPAVVPGSAKLRRVVETLRADVIQGLGVQLLEQVYELLEEEDDLEREVRLQQHMGEKYTAYSVKARQLKFFEENVNF
ncbi:serine/threonine-protein kinase Nek4 isoform X2 [Tenrec ecaudatus]|uniref:serine/threonine-protein kinase Nek4 isoform X2 n=1 Tax=Tenrec ecaudatus TaxID=94439 RepID=UPI003F591407